ncbi:hypothetical protein TSOC_011417 [Tetrabaena socialis]|uniref:YqaJ viral recombinase domain-containing protein n=1 Tax=Tetrabaena socialis TaxID=47790 RepID=A0A2J7ZQR0_9CHLO|nr:hypothetical protein TSOC_011417 [Tetrabaena socialis]|eukprot:PNH02590.1 hypothetical protein TSOC_011417 [Tetrabaena socialis]
MYEDVAQQVYCKRNGVRIHEFGLLKHPTVAHIGASPDGISELGVMLEIKCPYRRQITGEVPVQYYYQIQGQLEVCGLQECDYLELKLEESPRPDFYDTAGHTIFPERGVVAEFYDSEAGKTVYTYSGVDWPVSALQEFECKAVERDAAVKFHYCSWEDYSWQNTGEIMSRLEEMHLLQMCSVDESIRVAHIVSYATSDSHPLETERWISPGTKIHLEMWGLFQRLGSRWIRVVMAARTIQRGWRARSKMPIAK